MVKLHALRGGVAVAVITGALFLGTAPAQADWSDCPAGSACLWTSNNYPGSPQASFSSSIVLGSSDNMINSISNNGNSSVARFYDRNDRSGSYISLNNPARGGQSRDPNLSNGTDATSTNWANRISSAKFV